MRAQPAAPQQLRVEELSDAKYMDQPLHAELAVLQLRLQSFNPQPLTVRKVRLGLVHQHTKPELGCNPAHLIVAAPDAVACQWPMACQG